MHSRTILTIKAAAVKAHVSEAEIREAMKSGQIAILTTQPCHSQQSYSDHMEETPDGGPFITTSDLHEWETKRAFGSSEVPLVADFDALIRAAQARWHGPDGNWEGAVELLDDAATVLRQMEVDHWGHAHIDRDIMQACADRLRKAQDYCERWQPRRATAS